jgi:hypothetical protein
MALSLTKHDVVVRAVMTTLKEQAIEQDFPDHRLKAMQFKVECVNDPTRMQMILRVAWKDPDSSERRALSQLIDDELTRDPEELHRYIRMAIEQLNLRGELFYFKLHAHFPNRIERVQCTKEGRVTVVFKNGRSLVVDEVNLDSTEFLATCGMVYDL